MPATVRCTPRRLPSPPEVVRRWPRNRYLAALVSSPPRGGPPNRWSRWSILTAPVRTLTIEQDDPDPLGRLGAEIESTALHGSPHGPAAGLPFVGGWIVALGYELGRRLEPAAAQRPDRTDPAWPWSIVLWRCPWALVHDAAEGGWWAVDQGPHDDRRYTVPDRPMDADAPGPGPAFEAGPIASRTGRDAYERAAARAVEYVHAGDVFQVNLAHHLAGPFSGSARALWTRMLDGAGPWYGAYLELAQGDHLHAALGVSPELLLGYDPATRLATTRPIKGTASLAAGAGALAASVKDQAELNMIVDLMRNDLGRVCRFGTVRVAEARAIERHGVGIGGAPGAGDGAEMVEGGGVHHGVATVQGNLRAGLSVVDLLRAVVPGGSITGAPKVRAMQIIEELEPAPRGLYTGAVGLISDSGHVTLNIAIRTAVARGRRADPLRDLDEIAAGEVSYGVGAGIVADSVPAREWQETLDKAAPFLRAVAPAPTRPAFARPGPPSPQETAR